jgi:hypothetical protein
MEALVLSSCWVQDRARSKAVSLVLKRLLVLNSVCLPNSAGKMEALVLKVLLSPGQGEVQSHALGL